MIIDPVGERDVSRHVNNILLIKNSFVLKLKDLLVCGQKKISPLESID